jgi:hypothetical protein
MQELDEARRKYRWYLLALLAVAILWFHKLSELASPTLAISVVLAAIFAVLYVMAFDAYHDVKFLVDHREELEESGAYGHCHKGEGDDDRGREGAKPDDH